MAGLAADVVFHAAGLVRAGTPSAFEETNAIGSENVAKACAQQKNTPVLVLVSSLAAAGPAVNGIPRVEDMVARPVSAYGRSKLAAEMAVASFAKVVPISIARPGIVYGPGDPALLEMLKPIDRWGVHPVPGRQGTGNCLSLVCVEDLVAALVRIAESGERVKPTSNTAGTYFVAGDEQPNYCDLGQIMANALAGDGSKRKLHCVPVPAMLARLAGKTGDLVYRLRRVTTARGGDAVPGWINGDKMTEALAGSWVCSSAKIRSQLGWQPRNSLAENLVETVRWYRQAGWL